MLLGFRTANVRSLRDEQELSFVVPSGEKSDVARAVELSDGKQLQVYPLLGIFGANASGKSNVIFALKKMREAVLSSYGEWTSYQGIPRDVFALDPKAEAESSFYEVDFVLDDGVRWTYGFELGSQRVESEWLHAYPKGRRQVWFDRDSSREKVFDFPGDRLHDRALLARMTRPDALLLSRAANDNHQQLTRIFDWFKRNLWDITPETEIAQREAFTARRLLDERSRERIEELLRVADLGISGAEVEQRPGQAPLVRLLHGGGSEEPVPFDWKRESFGTRSWFALIGPLLLALDEGAVLLIDELDASLHPRFAAEVVRLFQAPWANTKGAQLVFTSHDPSLLSAPRGGRQLEPGQIWLTQKDRDGATEIYPLSDVEPGEDEDLTDSYLAGAFGGVPKLSAGQIGRKLLAVRAGEAEGS
ncbi:ATP/GTP-binding protein [Streptomyces sp. NBC_00059]|uniref:AAA family ATPase n=1 Tax=Streptomyces sp. NBC_00059 TaxID=2975635 RepID=UPI0022560CF4|nr:ATP-binding protein [Streptomyces sp. NBC_00059]MCX5410629.1 ATP-binding protein [Streptomyces sp. NBC_00059]